MEFFDDENLGAVAFIILCPLYYKMLRLK